MKKLPVLLLALLIWSCDQSGTKTQTLVTDSSASKREANQADTAVPDSISLNGIPKATALKMIADFRASVFEKVVPRGKVSMWFSRKVIDSMLAQLTKERGRKADGDMGIPDGFRIYFVSDPTDMTRLTTVWVATKKQGDDFSAPSKAKHTDYFHDPNTTILNIPDIRGQNNLGDCNGGALLFQRHCFGDCLDEDCNIEPEHRLPRVFGEAMTQNFGNNVINTRSVWFSYRMLKSIATHQNFSGIRLYYGNYGSVDLDGNTIADDVELKGRDTFILLPTYYRPGPGGRIVHEDQFFCVSTNSLAKKLKSLASRTDGYNNGELCPSHCNDDDGDGR